MKQLVVAPVSEVEGTPEELLKLGHRLAQWRSKMRAQRLPILRVHAIGGQGLEWNAQHNIKVVISGVQDALLVCSRWCESATR